MNKKVKEIKLGKRGYKAVVKNKKFNFGDGKHIYEVIELSGPKMDRTRIFVDEKSVRQYMGELEIEIKSEKLTGSLLKNVVSKKAKKDDIASKELESITAWDATTNIGAYIRDENAKRPEDNDK